MGLFQPDNGPFLIERRSATRSRATCTACLRTLTDESFGQLWDISQTGARISIANPPAQGEAALLRWESTQVMCRVVWSENDMCGLSFESPISAEAVSATARLLGVVERPTAAIGNIAAGRKRSAPGRSTAEAEREAGPANLLASHARSEEAVAVRGDEALTAEEEMFLYNSPLAHVLAYRAQLKSPRDR